ncbi:PSD1 and planctomycete cytochrome C domain-containing protein [Blastopirellula sp. JC732]|uniref:PSD1 and planctomycete cytochrome C domain-containing protein n=1 Tax=Blastopirellula sediminis TaxID=2894196 RepID=A0A9X1SHS9_9BACT|nr:PSD1 and planctomycete cytochrome C domain-containing protein [Blastopirellula sediminis]MCC9605130.1 PSD1 and planctomycete cytochrome C domain-containing protein [Blastopirellula sediminis]MCC9631570.1 PSD1 and planctomycete cytochrome C domain-containing protein [Blastopirellula sediminis]
MNRFASLLIALIASLFPVTWASGADPASAAIDYTRDIKPLLSNSCYTCHGPDEHTRKADFRLDARESAIDSVIVPGKPDESELIARLTSDDADVQMPPAASNRPRLSPQEVDLVRKWIAQGAKYDEHWSFKPAQHAAVPEVQSATPIDYFIDRRLAEQGIEPAAKATPRALIRRLYFDLTGLPPTPQEVAAFEADPSEEAYAKLVEKLLASPRFGERMAIHWLDLVRYADSVGIHGDQEWSMSPYRDYVIQSFNENKPFDQFTIEQLAGDLLPNATQEQQIASGYNRLNMITAEGGAQAKEYLAKYAADRVRTTSVVWLGATMGCCECHDHKFDPYTIKEFYQFAAFFADLTEKGVYSGSSRTSDWGPKIAVPTPSQTSDLQKLDDEIAKLKQTLETPTPELASDQSKWEAELPAAASWRVVEPTNLKSNPQVTWRKLEGGSVLATGANPDKPTYELEFSLEVPKVTAIRLEVMPDDSLPVKGPGRAGNGNFVLNGFDLQLDGKPVEFQAATATHSQDGWPVAGLLSKDEKDGWAALPAIGKANEAVFELKDDLALTPESKLTLTMKHTYGSSHAIGRFRISLIDAPRPIVAGQDSGVPHQIREIVALPNEKRSDQQRQELATFYRTIAPRLNDVRKELADKTKRRQELADAITTTLVSVSTQPRTMRVLPRGNWLDDSGEEVEPGIPGFLGYDLETNGQRATRRDLANWLIDRRNPLVARVFVNRLWQLMFGRGLVATADDFGSQGAFPSHPELLDWLATEFIESGWDVKHMMQLIAESEAYQRSSVRTAGQKEKDHANALLEAQSARRLPAEMIRDNALAASGLLVETIGGESVRPYQPAGYWSHLNFPKREYQRDKGDSLYRRGLYTHWQRTYLHPSLAAFDAPTREECTVRRNISNTPQQALVLMNDPTYVEAARALAVRLLQEGGDSPQAKINFGMQAVQQRDATEEEAKILLGVYEKHLQQYADNPESAKELLSVGEFQPPEGTDPVALAAWISVSRVLLNLHETITRY